MSGLSKIVRTIALVVLPFALVFGFYIIIHGHLTPGGGFQGGAVVASAAALLVVAFGSHWVLAKVGKGSLSSLESIGAVMFASLALLGIAFGAVYFGNFLAGTSLPFGVIPAIGSTLSDVNTGGVLPLMNVAVGLKVVAGLFAIVLVMGYATSVQEWD